MNTSSVEKFNIKYLLNTLPKSEYEKLDNIYNFIYNIFVFIFQVDKTLFDDTNFICNYIIHKQINKDIMYSKLCYGTTNIKFVNSLDVYYINLAGIDILLENVVIDKKSKTELPYNIINIINTAEINEEYLLRNLNKKSTNNYLKILFYLEIFNTPSYNIISKDIITDLKTLLSKL